MNPWADHQPVAAVELVWGHGLLAAAIVVALIVILAALDWIAEKDRRR